MALTLASLLLARQLTARTASLTGTNSVDVATVVASANSGITVCIRDLLVPARTGRLAVSLGVTSREPGARLEAELVTQQNHTPIRQSSPDGPLSFVDFSLKTPLTREERNASLCITPRRMKVIFGGSFVERLPGRPVSTVGRTALTPGDIGVKYLLPRGTNPRVASAIGDALNRAAVFDSGLGGALLWASLLALVLLIYVVVRVSATANDRSLRSLMALAVGVTFVHGAAWAFLLHPFHGPDESEHFAYAQYVAKTENRPSRSVESNRAPYSSSELRLMEALHHNSTILNPSSRLRWEKYWKIQYDVVAKSNSDADGGGYTESASGHSPFYYEIIGLPYRLFGKPGNLPSVLILMRLFNAVFAAFIAAIAVATAFMIFKQLTVSWLAGMIAGLQPVFGSVAGSVNNDTAVNLFAAMTIYLFVRTWSVGPSRRLAVLTAMTIVALPVSKITGFAVVAVVPVVAATLFHRYGGWSAIRWVATLGTVAFCVLLVWSFVVSPLLVGERGTLVNNHPAPTGAQVQTTSPVTAVDRGEYLLQTFVPIVTVGGRHWDLPATDDPLGRWPAYVIYVQRGYGLFGWKSAQLSSNMLHLIVLGLAVGWLLACVSLVRRLRQWRSWMGGVVILASSVAAVVVFIAYAYSTNQIRADAGEQGRYVFTALVPLSVMFSSATISVRGERARGVLTGAMAGSVSTLALLAWMSALRGWFI